MLKREGFGISQALFWQHLSSDHVYSPEKGAAVRMRLKSEPTNAMKEQ